MAWRHTKQWSIGVWLFFDLLDEWWDETSGAIRTRCPRALIVKVETDECIEVRVQPSSLEEASRLLDYLEKEVGSDLAVIWMEEVPDAPPSLLS